VQALEAEVEKNNHDIDVAHYLLTRALRNAAEAKAGYESQEAARNAELASLRQAVASAGAVPTVARTNTAQVAEEDSRSKALSDALERAQNDLITTRAELAEAQRGEEASKTEAGGATAERTALERQVADLRELLAAANRPLVVAQEEAGQPRRLAPPQRPYAIVPPIAVAAAAPPAPPPSRTHTVVEGDTLTRISVEYYGTARRWQAIFQANRDVVPNGEVLSIGTVLKIP
jgi:LysM repeat protein